MKLAIIGTGGIVREALTALGYLPKIDVTAIFARPHSKEKANLLAKDFSPLAKIYTDYAELLHSNEIDFVYIGLINTAHYDYAKQALMAGKNVILEKPFTPTYSQAAELARIAETNRLFLFEAMVPYHTWCFANIKKMLPELGKIRLVQANYSQYSSRYDAYLQGKVLPAFDPKCAGGALYDINIYNLAFIVGLFGAPDKVTYTANIGFNGIDTSGTAVLAYDDFTAVATGAKDSASPSFLLVQGEKGWLRLNEAPNSPRSYTVNIGGSENCHSASEAPKHRMMGEFKDFYDIYRAGDYDSAAKLMENTLAVMRVAEQARKSAGIVFPDDEVKI